MMGYIDMCVAEKKVVRVILMNGFQMCGRIVENADSHIIFLAGAGNVKKMIYKHAISTVEPA